MAIINLRNYMRFDRHDCLECNFTPSVIIHGQIPHEFSNIVTLINLKLLTLKHENLQIHLN